jgi:hypothetical protein
MESPLPETIETPNIEECNSLANLGFPNANGGSLPHFALIPKVLPVPPGHTIPEGHSAAALDLPTISAPNTYWQPFEIWAKSIKNMCTQNNGCPITASSSVLFNLSDLNPSETFPMRLFLMHSRFLLFYFPVPMLNVGHPATKELSIDNTNHALLMHRYASLTDIPPAFGTPTNAGLDIQALAAAVVTGVRAADRDSTTSTERATVRYQKVESSRNPKNPKLNDRVGRRCMPSNIFRL